VTLLQNGVKKNNSYAATEREEIVADDTVECDKDGVKIDNEIDWDNFDVEDASSFLEKSGLDKVTDYLCPNWGWLNF
jgi:hypothetical protein